MGRIETFSLPIPLTQSPRKIYVYLPDSYDSSTKTYPVLYMFDGHNLFDDAEATYGKCWGIRDYLDKTHLDLVVIGQDCSHIGNKRMDEYCPLPFTDVKWSFLDPEHVEGDITAKWFARVLKPACEKRYRIHKHRTHVGIAGSSMGGLMSEYCITAYNDVYSRAGCVSPASYFCQKPLEDLVRDTTFRKNTRIYIDLGSKESDVPDFILRGVSNMLELNHLYTEKGCTTWPNLVMGGTHSEASWETIFPAMLEFLFPELYTD